MAVAELKWKLVDDSYFFNTTTFYLTDDGNHLVYVGKEKRIKILIDDLNELVRKGYALWMELGEYDFELVKLSKCPTQTWYSIHQMLYSLEPWGVIKESKKSARKSIKEAKNITLSDLCDELGISYMDIYAIRYDDGNGISYYCNEISKVGIKILNNEAIQITGFGNFIGEFNFNNCIKHPISTSNVVLQDKSRYLDIYFK